MSTDSKKILIVEDEKDTSDAMKSMLEKKGYTVSGIARSGEEAIELAGSTNPDLILMDIRLEGAMDGLEAGGKIRETSKVPIVYMTGFQDRAEAIEKCGRAPLLKPFSADELLSAVEIFFYKGVYRTR